MELSLHNVINSDSKISELLLKLQESQTIAMMVIIGLQLARLLAVKLVENELAKRATEKTEWPPCPECNGRLESKGRKPRELNTLIGPIKWFRRCGRCTNKCRIGQVARKRSKS